jgi:2-aminoadipate transaminase
MAEACAKVLRDTPREALQYAASEGYGPLREWVAAHLAEKGLQAGADQVLITTGSQQGLDLCAKVLIDEGAPVAMETPTYLGALQAFGPFEPRFASLESDGDGPLPEALATAAPGTRFAYLLPNFQNPTGRTIPEARREALVAAARTARVPFIEDNPYGELWYDEPPPRPMAARWPEGVIYLGSFVAPRELYPKLLQAKQASDLHTPGVNQRVVHEVIRDGFLDRHVPTIRAQYRAQRDALRDALAAHLPASCAWSAPKGGMFFWVRLPEGCDALALLPKAVEAGMAYVPGAAFYAEDPDPRTLRLSFVTLTIPAIHEAIAALGQAVRTAMTEPALA